ncbi:Membrane associated serine protease, rhomboid family [Nakamurella panacisegetis]|uniref:Membrane associated serine protease, rhomboid family n=2 Tax=Nakamurella panacisegetis TaxID=1090615 RepID=A0A1H0HC61_9ACTN|nr:Membrane associated serine protease, rhomboid family [Nakamurella panacisegetis]
MVPGPTGNAPANKERSLLPAKIKPAVVTVGGFAVLITLIQVVNSLTSYRMDVHLGIVPRSVHGLIGILTAPLLHLSWPHLLSNLIPLVVFGFLIMVGSVRQFVAVTVLVWLIAGLGVWLVAGSNSYTVGASGVVFGWLAYLVSRGVFTRRVGQIAVGLVLLVIYGGLFWTGIVKVAVADIGGAVSVSWQDHLFGAIGGVLAAFLVAKADGPRRPKQTTPALPPGL